MMIMSNLMSNPAESKYSEPGELAGASGEVARASGLQSERLARATRLTVLALTAVALNATSVLAASDGKKIFMKTCAGCHNGGQNLIDPKHPIIGSKKLASVDTFKDYLAKPTKPMPPFPKIAQNDADLKALYEYCKTLK